MIAFDVFLNRKKIARAGVGSDGVLTAMTTWARRRVPETNKWDRELSFSLGGYRSTNGDVGEHFNWQDRKLTPGDVGKTFQIEAFNRVGCAELDLSAKVCPDTIWIEPFCVVRTRRPKTRSARFLRILAIHRRLKRPRWSFSYTLRYRARSPLSRLARLNASFGFGHGWYVLENRGEIHGTFSTYDRKASSRRQLEKLRLQLKKNGLFGALRVSRVRLST